MADDGPLSLEAFRELYPWSEESLALGQPLEYLWHFDLPAPPESLWRLLSDTSRLNREMGLEEMEVVERDGIVHGATRYGRVLHTWTEPPQDWVANRYLRVAREFDRGFARYLRLIYRVDPGPRGGRAYAYFGWIPRNWVGRLALRKGMRSMGEDHERVLRALCESDEGKASYRPVPARLPPAALTRIHQLRDQLAAGGLMGPALDELIRHVSTADPLDIYRIQVRRLAHQWGLGEHELLRVCLHATRAGLLEMSWDVICPHCRSVRDERRTLGQIPDRGACEACGIDFATDRQDALEITFRVHPSVREVPRILYCSGEPAARAHIQLHLPCVPGERRHVDTELAPGRYRLRLRGEKRYRHLDVDAGAAAAEVEWTASADGDLRSGPRPRLVLVNDSEIQQVFIAEEPSWAEEALRPAHLFTFQDFRDLFSEEYVAADVQLAVGEQTILFSDIVGSTRFYIDRGDPGAFMEVKRHFTEVYEIIKGQRGAVVKTIGDAAMGAFSDPLDALEAARQIHERFHTDRQDSPVRLRISLNTGPCIAVRLNSNIDYFGNAVNLAAKLQACAGPGDIAMSEAVHDAPGVADYLTGHGARIERLELSHEAFDQPVGVYCWATFAQSATVAPAVAE